MASPAPRGEEVVESQPAFPIPSGAGGSPQGACCASAAYLSDQLERARKLSVELRSVELQLQEVEQKRCKIRIVGPDWGRQLSYLAAGAMWLGAIIAASSAADIEDHLQSGNIDYRFDDTDGDGDVDNEDVKHSRRVARVLAGTSVIPLGLGVFSSILYRRRLRQSRELGRTLGQLVVQRRSLVDQLGATLDVGAGHALLRFRMAL